MKYINCGGINMSNLERYYEIFKNPSILEEARKDAVTNKIKGCIIDTCYCYDTDAWETGIKPKGEPWVIVEQYKDKKEALKNHKKWCMYVKNTEYPSFKDVLGPEKRINE